MRVLVTACGGDLGQAIIKALRLGPTHAWLAGTDRDADSVGSAFPDHFEAVPPAFDERFLDHLDRLCKRARIDAVIPASEAEIERLNRPGVFPQLASGAHVVALPASATDVHSDKLRCMEALADRIELAPFADGHDHRAVETLLQHSGFPVAVKPRRLSGSRHLCIAADASALASALDSVPDPVVQGYIDDSGGEYSVGVYRWPGGCHTIAFRRELRDKGCSWYAEVSLDSEVLNYALKVAEASGIHGAFNVQLRKGSRGCLLLELNPRFSSLVALRALCGFPDVEWSLAAAIGGAEPPSQLHLRPAQFRRFFHEVVRAPGDGAYRAVPEWQPRQGPRSVSLSEP